MISFFVKRPVATSMMFAAVLLLGVISLQRLKVSLFPDLVFPKLTVLTPYANVSPEEIENLVTRPIEDAVSSVNGVKKIVSRSQEGLSIVDVSLEWGASLDLATINIRQKVDLTRSVLPQDTGKSIIIKFDPSADPVITLVARPVNMPFKDLRDSVDKNVRPFFERINGVASISILGGYRREIQVNVDSEKLYGYGISLDQVIQALSAANFNFPAGNVRRGDREFTVRIQGEFKNTDEIANTVVSVSEAGTPVYLYQIAKLSDDYRDRRGSTYYNGEPAVIVGIKKEPGKNTIETARNVHAALAEINQRFARSVNFEVIQDRSIYIENAIASVRNAAFLGGAIAFLVLFIFLKDVRAALVVVASIPFAVISTFVLMYLRNISLNVMSLGGLALGVGMLVDNSIVVLESIYQARENHPDRSAQENAIAGAEAVRGSVMASTLTSVVVFVPIIFVPGIAGEVFEDLALTVSFSLISSLVCALTLIPMLASLDPAPGGWVDRSIRRVNTMAAPLFGFTEGAVVALREFYANAMGNSLLRPARVLLVAFALAIVGTILLWPLDKELFPDVDQGEVAAVMEMPGGTTIEDSEQLHQKIHAFLQENELSVHAVTNIGFDEDDLSSRIKGVRKGNYSESFFYINRDALDSYTFIEVLKDALTQVGGVDAQYRVKGDALQELLGESGSSLLFEVESNKRESAREIANFAADRLRNEELVRSLKSTATARDPEVKLFLDRDKISSFGMTPESVARVLRTAVNGSVATIYRENDREIDVRVRLEESDRRRVEQLHKLFVPAGEGQIELGELIRTDSGLGFPTILRENQRRLERIEVTFEADDQDEVLELLTGTADEAREHFATRFAGENRPEIRVREENEETLESLKNLIYAFLLSSILIYQLLAAQFESFLHPLTLALSIPMMLFGVSASLLLTGNSLNITSAIGMIMLVGIVVNASIVLYEYIQQNRAEQDLDGTELIEALPEILKKSGRDRIRPILLTTLTTVFGLVPMALGLGQGGDLQAPMAIAVIGGLVVGSVLTLVAFPTLYFVMERLRVFGLRGAPKIASKGGGD